MVLTVNGERLDVSSSTIPALLDELGYESPFLAVAVNHAVVRRAAWPQVALGEDDEVEILTPRQGG